MYELKRSLTLFFITHSVVYTPLPSWMVLCESVVLRVEAPHILWDSNVIQLLVPGG
jgi:hypothetical protein